MSFISSGSEIDPNLPLGDGCVVEAGGELLGWLIGVPFSLLTILCIHFGIGELQAFYTSGNLHGNTHVVFALVICIVVAAFAYWGIQLVRCAYLPIIVLQPGTVTFCNSLQPVPLVDIQSIDCVFSQGGGVIILEIKPEAPLPSLAPYRFCMPQALRVWRKHRVVVSLRQPVCAGELVKPSSVVKRLEQYWVAANAQAIPPSVSQAGGSTG